MPNTQEYADWFVEPVVFDEDEGEVEEQPEEELLDWEETAEGDDLDDLTSAARRQSRGFSYVRASEVESVEVEWLWTDRIPRGSLTLLTGDPGLGKSMLSCWLAAGLSRGSFTESPEPSLLLSAEDRHDAVVVPRLEAAEAALELVCIYRPPLELGEPFQLPGSIGRLQTIIDQTDAKLVIIDPLNAYLGRDVNSWKDQSIRTALAPLQAMAEETTAAIVLVSHLNKSLQGDALYRIGGSIGLAAAARSILLLARDPNDEGGEQGNKRVLAHVKSNFGEKVTSLSFEVETLTGGRAVPRLSELGESELTANELLQTWETGSTRGTLDDAKAFLEEALAEGPRPSRELLDEAREFGIAPRTFKRAKSQLGVISERDGSRWQSLLPAQQEHENQE